MIDLPRLKYIEVTQVICKTNCKLVINELPSLENAELGYSSISRENHICNKSSICQITKCPNLRHLKMGENSFCDVKQFELSNLESLQFIEFEWGCLKNTEVFSLKGKKELKQE